MSLLLLFNQPVAAPTIPTSGGGTRGSRYVRPGAVLLLPELRGLEEEPLPEDLRVLLPTAHIEIVLPPVRAAVELSRTLPTAYLRRQGHPLVLAFAQPMRRAWRELCAPDLFGRRDPAPEATTALLVPLTVHLSAGLTFAAPDVRRRVILPAPDFQHYVRQGTPQPVHIAVQADGQPVDIRRWQGVEVLLWPVGAEVASPPFCALSAAPGGGLTLVGPEVGLATGELPADMPCGDYKVSVWGVDPIGQRRCIGEGRLEVGTTAKPTAAPVTGTKQITHGDAEVSYGAGERPKYRALASAIDGFYRDLLSPLSRLRRSVFAAVQLEDDGAKQEEERPFRLTDRRRRIVDAAVEEFLTEMAGPDRTREGYVEGGLESETPDGVLQQRQVFSYAVGLRRAADLLDTTTTLLPARESPAVRAMLEHAFDRLSEGGRLRLEGVLDEIKAVMVAGQDAGLGPLTVARELGARFDAYQDFEFQRLARTEAAAAAEEGLRMQFEEFGVTHVEILVSAGACPICLAFVGKPIALEDTDSLPPYHPNCLCSTAPVAAPIFAGGLTIPR